MPDPDKVKDAMITKMSENIKDKLPPELVNQMMEGGNAEHLLSSMTKTKADFEKDVDELHPVGDEQIKHQDNRKMTVSIHQLMLDTIKKFNGWKYITISQTYFDNLLNVTIWKVKPYLCETSNGYKYYTNNDSKYGRSLGVLKTQHTFAPRCMDRKGEFVECKLTDGTSTTEG